MRRVRTTVTIALSTLLFVFVTSAQQTSGKKQNISQQGGSPIGIDGPVIGGDGTANYISIWATPNYLVSSVIYQASGGNIGIRTTTPAATLDVNGGINAATKYQIGGSSVLSIGSAADANVFLGVGAGASNIAGQGINNVFSGFKAGFSNTTGGANIFSGYAAGYSNTTGGANAFYGYAAGYSNTSGTFNTFSGWRAGYNNTTGYDNTFSGDDAGYYNTAGYDNTFSGQDAGWMTTSGYYNTFTGSGAGDFNTTGHGNTFYGFEAGYSNTTGYDNTFSGYVAGFNNSTGSSNVYIANMGPSSGDESNTIRIGAQGSGNLQQNTTYIAGIYGSASAGGIPVYINSSGQVGTMTSSLRFKEQVRNMGDSTNGLMKLRPVTFFYKPDYDKGPRSLQYGLIAEEVAKVYPDMVAYDKDGQPYTVKYQYLAPMLLDELQKQHIVVMAQQDELQTQLQQIKAQRQEIDGLKLQIQQQNASLQERLQKLESYVQTQMKIASDVQTAITASPGGAIQ